MHHTIRGEVDHDQATQQRRDFLPDLCQVRQPRDVRIHSGDELSHMIPPFDQHGYLPPGIHRAMLDAIAARFGRESEVRRAQMESIRWLVDLAKTAGVERLIINGSFVTDALEPNDVDCVLLTASGFPRDRDATEELLGGLPFIDMELVEPRDFAILVEEYFATDRDSIPKGVVEVIL